LCKFVLEMIGMKASKYIILFVFAILLFSCKKENKEAVVDYKFSYYPITTGYTLIYNVTEIIFSTHYGIS
jgi:hypothetical protein